MKAQKSPKLYFQKYGIQTKSSAVVRGGSRVTAEPSKFWDLSENETLLKNHQKFIFKVYFLLLKLAKSF